MFKKLKRKLLLILAISLINIIIICIVDYKNNNSSGNSNYLFKETLKENKSPASDKNLKNTRKYLRYECLKPLCGGWADRLKGKCFHYN